MKKQYSLFFLIFLFSFGINFYHAQDSKEITSLKSKLNAAKIDIDRAKLSEEIANTYIDTKNIDSALVYGKISLSSYKKLNNIEQIGRSNLFIGNLLTQKMNIAESEKYLIEAEKYLNKTENYDKRALNYYLLASVNSMNKNSKVANEYCNLILNLDQQKKIKDKKLVLLAYQRLFQNNFAQENPVQGYKSLNTYIEFTKANFPEYLYQAYNLAGIFYLSNKDFRKSLKYFDESLTLANKSKDDFKIANSKMFIGNIYSETKQYEKARTFLEDSKQYFEKNKLNDNLKMIYYYLSDIDFKQKKYEKAETEINKSLALSSDKDPMYNYYVCQKGLINLNGLLDENIDFKTNLEKQNELKNLIRLQSQNLDYFENQKTIVASEIFIQNYEALYKAYEKLGNYEKALFYLKKFDAKSEETYGLEKMKSFADTQSDFELQEQKAKIELQEQTKRFQLQKEIELKALKFEYEKKQAAAKTEEERRRLLLEEDLKRKEIQIKYEEQQKAANLKFLKEKEISKINQEKKDAIAKAELETSKSEKNMWAIGAALSLLLLGFAGYSYNQKRKDNKKIAEEKQKSENLLLNILPHEVAEELKEKGTTRAKHFDEVSVIFTDFVNFTANSEKIGVQEVLNELNICFTEFDNIMEKHGLEKIKTIGDAYLAVSGLPVSNKEHAKNAVKASLEILSYIQQRKLQHPNALDIRIGIHSGPLIAGIVGVKKFAYDIWGDTVNTAARMEQNSASGKLNISEATYQLVKDDFVFEYRGKIETKGKGALDMYFVNQA